MKLAFCFLIYDIINHEELWNIFFNNIDISKYNIYIHYKYNKPLKYFEKYKLNNCIETKYENQTIPLAYNLLFSPHFEPTLPTAGYLPSVKTGTHVLRA